MGGSRATWVWGSHHGFWALFQLRPWKGACGSRAPCLSPGKAGEAGPAPCPIATVKEGAPSTPSSLGAVCIETVYACVLCTHTYIHIYIYINYIHIYIHTYTHATDIPTASSENFSCKFSALLWELTEPHGKLQTQIRW